MCLFFKKYILFVLLILRTIVCVWMLKKQGPNFTDCICLNQNSSTTSFICRAQKYDLIVKRIKWNESETEKHNSYTIKLYIFLFVSLRSEHNILTQYNLIFVICRSTLKYKDLINYKMNTNNLKVCLLFLCIAAIIVFVETELVEIGFIVL